MLCRLAGFKEGLVLLYDRLRLYREVMQVRYGAIAACGQPPAKRRLGWRGVGRLQEERPGWMPPTRLHGAAQPG